MGKAFRELIHYMDVTAQVIKMAVMTIIEYPSNIAGWMISNPLQFIMGFAIIKFVVESFGEINGWNYGQLAFLYGISVISHALSMIFFVQGWFMGYYVIEGDFDRYLTRPLGVLYQFFFTNINIFGVTDLIPGILVFIYGCIKCEVTVNLLFVLQVVIILIGATLIRGGIYILLGSTSFHLYFAGEHVVPHAQCRGLRAVHAGDHGQDNDVSAVHVPREHAVHSDVSDPGRMDLLLSGVGAPGDRQRL